MVPNMSNPPSSSEAVVYKPQLTVDVQCSVPFEETALENTNTPNPHTHVSTNIFVAGLPSHWDEELLRAHYLPFGEVISTKVVPSKHFGFVMFRRAQSAHEAINATHLTKPTPQSHHVLHVSMAMHDEGVEEMPNSRLFVRGLPQWTTREHVRSAFSPFGVLLDVAVLMNRMGQCKGSGFVQFSSLEEAKKAMEASEAIRIQDWDKKLEIKYSESPEVRQQRQERNRNRQRNSNLPSPSVYSNYTTLPTPYSMNVSPLPVLAHTSAFPIFNSVSVVCTPPTSTIFHPTPVFIVNSIPLPSKGDLHFYGFIFTEDLIRLLLQPFGPVEQIKILSIEEGAAVRMAEPTKHESIAQQLNGTIFETGHVLSVGIYS